MNVRSHFSPVRTHRRSSSAAIPHLAATDAQAARFAALDTPRFGGFGARAPFWDDGLLARLTPPVSRIRE